MRGGRESPECNPDILQLPAKPKEIKQFHHEPFLNWDQIVGAYVATRPVRPFTCAAEIKAVLVPDVNKDLRIRSREDDVSFGQFIYFSIYGRNDCFNELVVADRCHSP